MNSRTKIIQLVILLAIFIISIYQICSYMKEGNTNKKINADLINKAVIVKDNNSGEDTANEEGKETIPITVNFEELKKENADIVGWIYSEDTPINYPVVKGNDNQKYVNTLINGRKGSSGTLFMDYRNDGNLQDANSIIYGHNMKNATMFGSLQKYRNQSYYDKHKFMYYMTPEKNYKLELFSGYTTNVYSDIYDLKEINSSKINGLMRQSDFKAEVVVNEEDKFLTLSTCAYDYDDARYILIGVLREFQS